MDHLYLDTRGSKHSDISVFIMPVFMQLDTEHQFVVEVEASDTRVGVVLSQRSVTDKKNYPCAFLSKKLSAAKHNYSVGDR